MKWIKRDRSVPYGILVLISVWAMHAHTYALPHTAASKPTVVVRANPSLALVAFDQLVVQLRAGLATSGIDVYASEAPNRRLLALVELEAQPADSAKLRIRLNDHVTSKTLE
jgi:hypothetical protein